MPVKTIVLAIALLASPLTATGLLYEESQDGEIPSYDDNAPTPIGTLDAGVNVVSGSSTAVADWGDVFSVDVPPGFAITDVVLEISAHTGGFGASVKLFEVPFQPLDGYVIASDGTTTFTIAQPLAAPGPYGFGAAFSNAQPGDSYAWEWTITVPEPATMPASLAASAALLALAGARPVPRRRGGR